MAKVTGLDILVTGQANIIHSRYNLYLHLCNLRLTFLHLFPSVKLIGNQLYLQQLSWGLYSISFSSSISIIIESHPLFFISYPMMSLFTMMILDLHSATFSQAHSFASTAISNLHYNKLRIFYFQNYIFLTISVQLWDSFKGWKISTIILLIRLVMIWLTYENTNLKRTWVWSNQFLPPKPFNCMKFEVVNSFSKITFRITTLKFATLNTGGR